MRDLTCFQTGPGYSPDMDIASDMAVVYGVSDSLAERVQSWRDNGYAVGMMMGIAWGGYDAYFVKDGVFKKEEVQTCKDGTLRLHDPNSTCGYNVPTLPYVEYLKGLVAQAVDAGVEAVFLEEPEYWAETGWSEAFKKEWADYYGEPWQPPDSSVDAQYRASRLKYELYFRALKEVFADAKARAAARGSRVECAVPTHSLINYAQWRIVSPESHLCDIPQLDGYVAQVWTGTARSPNFYRGVHKERTFETAWLEYAQMVAMVRPTGRKLWCLADPVEDNPNRSWSDYKRNYECTLVASLMWPEVFRFEVMPWPQRIFAGSYVKTDLDAATGKREGIPADYATEILTVINALNDMNQADVRFETGPRGIGVVVSDTMMFQRAEPSPSDAALGPFYGLALPLLKTGVPVEVVQLENVCRPDCLAPFKVLLLTYEHQKPLRPEYHDALAQWVRDGGCLLYIGDGSDPYHHVREWWNEQGKTNRTPAEHLFDKLGVQEEAAARPQAVGSGFVRVVAADVNQLARSEDGAEAVVQWVRELIEVQGGTLAAQNYICVRRGPYVVAAVLDESVSDQPLVLRGSFVDLFDAQLPVHTEVTLQPNQRALLYDLEYARKAGKSNVVAACAGRVCKSRVEGDRFRFTVRGPTGTTARARVLLAEHPTSVAIAPEVALDQAWDEASSTLWLSFPNTAREAEVSLPF